MLQLHFAEFLKTGALVLPIQIERHWRDNAASTPPPPRGYCWISCRVAVSIDVCDVCNAKTLRGGDKILEEAFQREYDKAANSSRSRRAA
jgi:hypothetical protein